MSSHLIKLSLISIFCTLPMVGHADVSINEVMAKDAEGGPDWVELTNTGPDSVDLSGWTLTDSDNGAPHPDHLFTFPEGTALNGGAYLVLVEDAASSIDFGFGKSDGVFLSDATGALIDSTVYTDGDAPAGGSWGRFPDGVGAFQSLSIPTLGSENTDEMPEPTPTPPTQPGLEDSDYIFDASVVRTYELQMTDENWQWLQDNALLEEYVPGDMTFEGQTTDNVGIRFKGSAGSLTGCFDEEGNQICDKLSMKINFHKYTDDGRFYGLRKLQFHAMMNDPSKMHDRLGYDLWLERGIPAPRTSYVRLVINGELMGLYVLVEQIDESFVSYHYEDDTANLYKEVWPLHFEPEPYEAALKSNEDDGDVSAMVNFAADIANVKGPAYRDTLEKWMEPESVMAYLAVDRSINNWDGIMGWYCWGWDCYNHNNYWYQSSESDTFHMIPWDIDFTFSPINDWEVWLETDLNEWNEKTVACRPEFLWLRFGMVPGACDDLIGGWVDWYWQAYTDEVNDFLNTSFEEEGMVRWIDSLEAQLRPHVEEDPDLDVVEWEEDVAQIRAAIPLLRERMQVEIAK